MTTPSYNLIAEPLRGYRSYRPFKRTKERVVPASEKEIDTSSSSSSSFRFRTWDFFVRGSAISLNFASAFCILRLLAAVKVFSLLDDQSSLCKFQLLRTNITVKVEYIRFSSLIRELTSADTMYLVLVHSINQILGWVNFFTAAISYRMRFDSKILNLRILKLKIRDKTENFREVWSSRAPEF